MINGNLYYYHKEHSVNGCTDEKCRSGCKHQPLRQAIIEAFKHFRNKFGYSPRLVIVREDEYNKDGAPCKVKLVSKGLPPNHFMLGPFIKRFPRRLPVAERMPYEDS